MIRNIQTMITKTPLVFTIVTWIWNIISVAALCSCIYIYFYIKPQFTTLKQEKRTHLAYKDSVEVRLKYINSVIEDKEKEVLESEEELDKAQNKLKTIEIKLLKNLEVLDSIYIQRDSIMMFGKKELTDDEREIYLNNKFYNRNNIYIYK